MKKFFSEFKEFAMRGNVIDLAVGVVIGGAFGAITTSLVNDIIMPLISMITGGLDFSAWKWVLKEASLNEFGEIIAPVTVNYGNLISVILNFIIVAFAIFCVVKSINKAHELAEKRKKKEEAAAPAAPAGPTTEELLVEIRDLLKKQ